MVNIITSLVGNLEEKREYKKNEARAKALPAEYLQAYREIKKYIFQTSGILTAEPLKILVDMFEEASANGKPVIDIIGTDVASFADELVRGEDTYFEKQREKLNSSINKKTSR